MTMFVKTQNYTLKRVSFTVCKLYLQQSIKNLEETDI